MTRVEFSDEQVQNILRAKLRLKNLIAESPYQHKEILEKMQLKKSTLSSWLSPRNKFRPKKEAIQTLIEICLKESEAQKAEVYQEILYLFSYTNSDNFPEQQIASYEKVLNKIYAQLDTESLQSNEALLDQLTEVFVDFMAGKDMLRLDNLTVKNARKVLNLPDESSYQIKKKLAQYKAPDEVSWAYEVPLKDIYSTEYLQIIVNFINELGRALRIYIENYMLWNGPERPLHASVEALLDYVVSVASRLLHYNPLCQNTPFLNKSLINILALCYGCEYLLKALTKYGAQPSYQQLKSKMQRAGKSHQADLNCAAAVYIGSLARKYLQTGKAQANVQKGLQLFEQAFKDLEYHHQALASELDRYFYKKELANLCFDAASLMLFSLQRYPQYTQPVKQWMQTAFVYYQEVIESPNLFYSGLNAKRAHHLHCFALISFCYTHPHYQGAVEKINQLPQAPDLEEGLWMHYIVKAIAHACLYLKHQADSSRDTCLDYVAQAQNLPGFAAHTVQELQDDFFLQQMRLEI